MWCEAFSSFFALGGPFGHFRGSSCGSFFSPLSGFLKHQKGLQKRKLDKNKGFKL